jgi:hypothetical protein
VVGVPPMGDARQTFCVSARSRASVALASSIRPRWA